MGKSLLLCCFIATPLARLPNLSHYCTLSGLCSQTCAKYTMKIKEIITEITEIPQSDYVGGKAELQGLGPVVKWAALPGYPTLKWGVLKLSKVADVYIIDSTRPEGEQVIGLLALAKYSGPIPNAYEVSTITVDEDWRNTGIAKTLYSIVLHKMKSTLVAGESQTPAGKRNWLSLAHSPGVEVKGMVAINDSDFGHTRPARTNASDIEKQKYQRTQDRAEEQIDLLVELGLQYVGKGQNTWGDIVHYFAFDVEGGNGQVDPAIKNALSHIYSYGARADAVTMYAKLTKGN